MTPGPRRRLAVDPGGRQGPRPVRASPTPPAPSRSTPCPPPAPGSAPWTPTSPAIRARSTCTPRIKDLHIPGPKPDLFAADPVTLDVSARLDAPDRPVTFTLHHPLVAAEGTAHTEGVTAGPGASDLPNLTPLAAAGGTNSQRQHRPRSHRRDEGRHDHRRRQRPRQHHRRHGPGARPDRRGRPRSTSPPPCTARTSRCPT